MLKVAFAELARDERLGFARLAPMCLAEFGLTLTSIDDIGQCLVAKHECAAERLFATIRPRAGELLRTASVERELVGQLTCLPDRGGAGAPTGNPKTLGKSLEQCAKTLAKAATKLALKRLQTLEKCVDAVFDCEQQKPGDDACLAKAGGKCDKAFAKIAREEEKFDAAVAKKCDTTFATLRTPTGGNVDALADECAAVDVASILGPADHRTCLARHITCAANALIGVAAPRTVPLLTLIGQQARVDPPFCPLP